MKPEVRIGSRIFARDAAIRLLTAADAVAVACEGGFLPPDGVLLVLAEDAHLETLADLCRPSHPGPVIASTTAKEAAPRISTTTGRADAIVTLHQAREAVRAVRRGGIVCLPALPVDAPTVTELVQREVRLIGARSLPPVPEALTTEESR